MSFQYCIVMVLVMVVYITLQDIYKNLACVKLKWRVERIYVNLKDNTHEYRALQSALYWNGIEP